MVKTFDEFFNERENVNIVISTKDYEENLSQKANIADFNEQIFIEIKKLSLDTHELENVLKGYPRCQEMMIAMHTHIPEKILEEKRLLSQWNDNKKYKAIDLISDHCNCLRMEYDYDKDFISRVKELCLKKSKRYLNEVKELILECIKEIPWNGSDISLNGKTNNWIVDETEVTIGVDPIFANFYIKEEISNGIENDVSDPIKEDLKNLIDSLRSKHEK